MRTVPLRKFPRPSSLHPLGQISAVTSVAWRHNRRYQSAGAPAAMTIGLGRGPIRDPQFVRFETHHPTFYIYDNAIIEPSFLSLTKVDS